MMKKKTVIKENLDEPWKAATEDLTPDYLEFVFPDVYAEIDWSVPPIFLDKEIPSRIKGRRSKYVDKFLLVQLLNGDKRMLLIHIEFESHPRAGTTPERMFRYFYLLREIQPAKYRYPITALVMYVGKDVPTVYDRYEYEAFGTRLTYQFNTYQVREQNEATLRKHPNPFALIVLANLLVIKSSDDPEKRLSFKQQVYVLASERNYPSEKAQAIITFAEEAMRLPDYLEATFQDFLFNTSTPEAMRTFLPSTINLANAVTKQQTGYTMDEMSTLLSQKNATLSQKDVALSQKDAALSRIIVRLVTQEQRTPAEIAEMYQLDIDFIHDVLRQQGL